MKMKIYKNGLFAKKKKNYKMAHQKKDTI